MLSSRTLCYSVMTMTTRPHAPERRRDARPPGPATPGDHRRDPRHRRGRHDRGGRQRAEPLRGGAATRRAAPLDLQVLPVPHGHLRRALPAWPARAPRGHARRDGRQPTRASMRSPPGLEASGRWSLANRAVAELLFWRPVPSFEPSPEAMAPSQEMVDMQRAAFADAVTRRPTRARMPTPTKPSTSCRP